MKFNRIIRGAKREQNDEQTVFDILDAGFICHVSFMYDGRSMMIPTAYGRDENHLYFHGSSKNFMLNQLCDGQTVCVCVTHLDGIVLARNLFHSSVNYRSVVLFGKAELIGDYHEKSRALTCICENIVRGRSEEVPLGSVKEIESTLVIRFDIESASAKVRTGHPMNDESETDEVWSGVIPLRLKAETPIQDTKFGLNLEYSPSVNELIKNTYE